MDENIKKEIKEAIRGTIRTLNNEARSLVKEYVKTESQRKKDVIAGKGIALTDAIEEIEKLYQKIFNILED